MDFDAQIAALLPEISSKEMAAAQLKEDQTRLEAALREAKEAPQRIANEIQALEDQLVRYNDAKNEYAQRKKDGDEETNKYRTLLATHQHKLTDYQQHLVTQTAGAAHLCSRDEERAVRAALIDRWKGDGKNEDQIKEMLNVEHLQGRLEQLQTRIDRRERDAGTTLEQLEVDFWGFSCSRTSFFWCYRFYLSGVYLLFENFTTTIP